MPTLPQPNTTASAKPTPWLHNAALWIVALWAVGLMATAVLTLWLDSYQKERLNNRFNTELERVTHDIQLRFEKPAFALMGARGMYAASDAVNRQEFQRYVESRDLAKNFDGVRGMGFIERVQRPALGAFIEREQADRAPDFAVRSLGTDGDDLYVIKFIEPLNLNRAAFGLDMGSEAVRREGAERAARSGQPALSGVIQLVQDNLSRPALLIFLPVYRPGRPVATADERLAALWGLAYSPIVLEELLQPGLDLLRSGGLHMQILDKPLARGGTSLFKVGSQPAEPMLKAEVPLGLLGSTLFIQAQSTPAFEAKANRLLVFGLGAAGVLLSTLLSWVLWLQVTGRARAEAHAQRMTVDLQKLALVAKRTANAVVMVDTDLRITWVNEGFTRICGYTAEEAVGRTLGDLLGSEQADPATLQQLKNATEQGVACRVEILNRAKDGRLYWLDTEVQPIGNEAGQLIGSIEIGLDVTQQRTTNERLVQALLASDAQQRELDVLARVARDTTNAVVLTDTHGLIEWVNEGFTRITGYTLQEALGHKPGWLLQCPDTDPQTVLAIREALAQRQPCRAEILNRAKSGRMYWLELDIQPILDDRGQHTGFMAIQSEVTDRRETLDRLKRAVRENESLMSAISQGTIYSVADLQGNITDVNDAFVRISGHERDALIGANHRLLKSGAQSAEFWSAAWAAISSGQVWRGEVCNRNKNGDLYWVDSTIVPFVGGDGMVEKYISIRTDITHQKQAQAEIEFQRKRLDNILRGTRAGTWEWHVPSGRYLLNERWAKIIGYTLDELAPVTADTWTRFLHPDDVQTSADLLQRHFSGELDFYETENRMRHRDGHWIWVQDRGQVVSREADGSPGWMSGTHLDITERKEAENKLRESETLFKGLLDVASDWYWETDDQYRFSNFVATHDTANYRALSQSHLGARRWDVVGVTPVNGGWAAHIAAHERRESFRNFEYRRELPSGEIRYYAISGFPAFDSCGVFKGYRGTTRDATAQKQQEVELQTARDRVELATESAGIGIWIFDVTHNRLEWDDRMFQLYGLDADPSLLLDDGWTRCLHPQDQARGAQAVVDALSGKKDFDLEFRVVWPTGEVRHIRGTARVQRDAQADTVRMVGVNFDITEQRERERRIASEEIRLRAIYDILPVGISITDRKGQIIDCNPASERMLGITKAEHLARTYDDKIWSIHREDGTPMPAAEFASVRALTQKTEVHDVVMQVVTDQHSAWLSVSAMPMAHDDFGVVIAYVDITASRQAQEKIALNEALLRSAIDAVDEAFVLYDPQDRLVFCNEKYREVYANISHLMVPGTSFESIVRIRAEMGDFEEAIGRVDAWVAERMERHREPHSELLQKLTDGRTLRIIERRMPDGHTVGFRIDITDLVNAKEQAQAASHFKGQFLANMSHEIRTPMNAILGMLKLMHNTALQPRQLDYVQKTEGAAKSLLGLLNDILDFSKVEAGKMALDPQPFQLDQLMRDLSVIFSASVGHKPVEVLFDIDPRVPHQLLGDSLRLQQILINLGGNAIKFTAKGEVVVRVHLEGMQGQAPDQQARVNFAVTDSGIGIAPENQDKIFAGFTQAEASTTRRFGGTGLGLSICRRLIEMMGGQLRLASAVDEGSTFSFSVALPVVDAPASAASKTNLAQAALAPWCTPGMPVLVVDDNPVARELMANMGDSLGWCLETADSGEAALTRIAVRHAQGTPYQAVFVDWTMPGLDGWQTSARIRSLISGGNSATASPLIMMVTAHGRDMLSQQTTEVQALIDGYLVKPVTASMLLEAMQLANQPNGAIDSARSNTPVVQPLAGLRILLVEDNAINQQVAEELLSGQGAAVDIADNGRRGVEAVQAAVATGKPYDAVLMDMQMPVMDGLTAAREIRGRLANADLPIIAMTANAMASDREACLVVGMNDHVGKPFDLERLVTTLLQWTRGAAASAAGTALAPTPVAPHSATVTTTATANANATIEVEGDTAQDTSQAPALLNRKGALQRVGGSTSLLNRLSVQFLTALPRLVQTCEAITSPDQLSEALRALHSLKGVAATIGADALAQVANEAEQHGKNGGVFNLDHLDHLRQVVASTQQALLHIGIAAPADPANTASTDGEYQPPLTLEQREILDRLLPLLEASDLAVFDAMEELLAEGADNPKRWAALDGEVQAMAFERAAQRVRQWQR